MSAWAKLQMKGWDVKLDHPNKTGKMRATLIFNGGEVARFNRPCTAEKIYSVLERWAKIRIKNDNKKTRG